MIDKCSLGNMNNNLKIIGLIFIAFILFIVILYYFKNTIDKHNNLMEKFSSNVATIDYSNSYTNTSSVHKADQDNDTYNGDITLRNCQVYFVGEDEKNACDASYIADPLNTTCKYEFKDGWKEIESIQGSENQRNDIQKKIYNKDYGNIKNIDNQYYMSSCFKEMQDGDNNFRYMGNEHIMHDNIGTVNDQTSKNNTLRLNTKGTGTMSNYISKKFFNNENNTNLSNNNNMLDSICSIKYNNIPNLKTDFYKFKLIQIDNEWVMEDLKDVELNDTQTSFGGDKDSTFVGNEAYGVFVKSFTGGIVKLSIFKKSSVVDIPNLKVYRFKYNYLCDGKVLDYSNNITTTIKMDKLVDNSGGNEISDKTLNIHFYHSEINDNFWNNDLFKSNNFDNKIVDISNGLRGLEELYIQIKTDFYAGLAAPYLEIISVNNALRLTAIADKELFHTQVNISGVEEGNFKKKSIIGLTKNGNINFNYNSGYNIIVRDKIVSKTIGKYAGTEPITSHNIKPKNIGEDYKYISFDYNPNISRNPPILSIDSTKIVAHYKFDGNFNDSSGNGHHLRAHRGIAVISKAQFKYGSSSYFSSSSLITYGYTFHNKPFSVCVWLYQISPGAIINQHVSNSTNRSLHLEIRSSFTYTLAFYNNDIDSRPYPEDRNQWVHICWVVDNSKNRYIYRNGVIIASDNARTFVNTGNSVVNIGTRLDNNSRFGGYMDDLRVYDTVLTQADILELYDNTKSTKYDITFPEETECDILVVGGGGAGGYFSGGGGGGSVLFKSQIILNGVITIQVGRGGVGDNDMTNGENGQQSKIIINSVDYIADGGGGGGARFGSSSSPPYLGRVGNDGGSGGGGASSNDSTQFSGGHTTKTTYIYTGWETNGFNGGKAKNNGTGEDGYASGGGGGAGGLGGVWDVVKGGGLGGLGKDYIAYFGTSVGHNGYFGGGGGGGSGYDYDNIGFGNGGNGLFGGGGNGAHQNGRKNTGANLPKIGRAHV